VIKGIIHGLEMAGRVSTVLAGVELGRRAYEAAQKIDADAVDGEEVDGGAYPRVFRLDPFHWVTPTPAEWAVRKHLESQGATKEEIRDHIREARKIGRDQESAEAAAAAARTEAEQAETARRERALRARAAGDARLARAEAKAAILSQRFRQLSAALSSRAAVETDPERSHALATQAAATAALAKAPPAAVDMPQGKGPLAQRLRGLWSAVASRAGDKADELADRIRDGDPLDSEDLDEEISDEAALALVVEGAGLGELVEGCGCAGAVPEAPPAELAGLVPGEDLLAAFRAMGGDEADGPDDDDDEPSGEPSLSEALAFDGSADLEVDGSDGGGMNELLAVFAGAVPRAACPARLTPSRSKRPRGACSGGSCPV